ncbi:hypothetical protein KO566_08040 [Flavobacteriaceae bacterium XHP0103]|nr:hypothetical protein [Marixanthotalea marina]MBU3822006.1 hypothetical protein [Marixanthotalea marina]
MVFRVKEIANYEKERQGACVFLMVQKQEYSNESFNELESVLKEINKKEK